MVILVHLMILIGDVYFGENNDVWFKWIWFYDLLVIMTFLFILWKDELYLLSWLG